MRRESEVGGERGEAFHYLRRLLPEVPQSEIALALDESDKEGLVATISDVGFRVGAQFYRVDAPVDEVLAEAAASPVLELSESPRVLVRADNEEVYVIEGNRQARVHLGQFGREPRPFIVPSPRMTLASLRGRKRVQRVISYLATERSLLKSLLIYAIFVEGLSLAAPLAVQLLINTVGFGMMTQQLVVISLMLLAGLAGAATLAVFQQILVEHLSRRFFARTVMDYSERLPLLQAGGTQNPVHRFFEVASVDKAFFALGLDLIALVLQLAAATILLSFYHPILLSFTLVMAVSSWLIVRLPFSAALTRSLEESKAKYELGDYLKEGGDDEVKRLSLFSRWEESRRAGFRIALGQQIGLQILQVVLSVVLLFMGGMLVIEGNLTLGQLVAAELVAGTALMSLNKLGKQLPKIYDLITSFEKLGGVVDLPFREVTTGFSTAPELPLSMNAPEERGEDRV